MSYIQKLGSLDDDGREKAIKSLILKFSDLLIQDKARRKVVSGDLEGSWDEVDEVELDEVSIDPEKLECWVKFRWQSYGPHDEDDERTLYGWATAQVADDRTVSFTDTHVELEGTPPSRPKGSSATDVWWEEQDENNREGWTDDMNKDS